MISCTESIEPILGEVTRPSTQTSKPMIPRHESLIREEKEGTREDGSRILPILALNEVFIGESLSSRVSYLELQVIVYCPPKEGFRPMCVKRSISSSHLKRETVDFALPLELVRRMFQISIFKIYLIIIHSGSTSWIFNVNKMAHHAVESLLKITFETTRLL